MTNLQTFLIQPQRNSWVVEGIFNVYVRKSQRCITGKLMKWFDLASIESRNPGSKTFRSFIKDLELVIIKQDFEGIYVESILNKRLIDVFKELSYTPVPNSDPICYYKQLKAV